jgi:hypothetical protein
MSAKGQTKSKRNKDTNEFDMLSIDEHNGDNEVKTITEKEMNTFKDEIKSEMKDMNIKFDNRFDQLMSMLSVLQTPHMMALLNPLPPGMVEEKKDKQPLNQSDSVNNPTQLYQTPSKNSSSSLSDSLNDNDHYNSNDITIPTSITQHIKGDHHTGPLHNLTHNNVSGNSTQTFTFTGQGTNTPLSVIPHNPSRYSQGGSTPSMDKTINKVEGDNNKVNTIDPVMNNTLLNMLSTQTKGAQSSMDDRYKLPNKNDSPILPHPDKLKGPRQFLRYEEEITRIVGTSIRFQGMLTKPIDKSYAIYYKNNPRYHEDIPRIQQAFLVDTNRLCNWLLTTIPGDLGTDIKNKMHAELEHIGVKLKFDPGINEQFDEHVNDPYVLMNEITSAFITCDPLMSTQYREQLRSLRFDWKKHPKIYITEYNSIHNEALRICPEFVKLTEREMVSDYYGQWPQNDVYRGAILQLHKEAQEANRRITLKELQKLMINTWNIVLNQGKLSLNDHSVTRSSGYRRKEGETRRNNANATTHMSTKSPKFTSRGRDKRSRSRGTTDAPTSTNRSRDTSNASYSNNSSRQHSRSTSRHSQSGLSDGDTISIRGSSKDGRSIDNKSKKSFYEINGSSDDELTHDVKSNYNGHKSYCILSSRIDPNDEGVKNAMASSVSTSSKQPTYHHVAIDHCSDISITPRIDLLKNIKTLKHPLWVNTINGNGRSRKITQEGTMILANGRLKINNFKYLPDAPYTILCGADLGNAGLISIYTTTACHIIPKEIMETQSGNQSIESLLKKKSYVTFQRLGKLSVLELDPEPIVDPKSIVQASYQGTNVIPKVKDKGSDRVSASIKKKRSSLPSASTPSKRSQSATPSSREINDVSNSTLNPTSSTQNKSSIPEKVDSSTPIKGNSNNRRVSPTLFTKESIKMTQDNIKDISNIDANDDVKTEHTKNANITTRSSRRKDSPAPAIRGSSYKPSDEDDEMTSMDHHGTSSITDTHDDNHHHSNEVPDYSKYDSDIGNLSGVDSSNDESISKWSSQQ